MKAIKILINGNPRILLEMTENPSHAKILRQLDGSAWSPVLCGWHIPYSGQSFRQLISLFPGIEYPRTGAAPSSASIGSGQPEPSSGPQKNVMIRVTETRIWLRLPKNPDDIRFIHTMKYSKWNQNQFVWEVTNYPGNLSRLLEYFGGRLAELNAVEETIPPSTAKNLSEPEKTELLIVKTLKGRLKLKFPFDPVLRDFIKGVPYHRWEPGHKLWSVPFSDKVLNDLKRLAADRKFKVIVTEEERSPSATVKRIGPGSPGYRPCPTEYVHKLEELRYSRNTIRTYRVLFEEFINHYPGENIDMLNTEKIMQFLHFLVTKRNISTSYQNQSINAIKFYYERVKGGPRQTYYIDRPIPEKALPEVLSMEEVQATIRQVKNIKHLAIITLIYSSGLRLNELINLRITDIDSKRMQVFVRQSKGRKDRYTLLSVKALETLRRYFGIYQPKEWLFEGTTGQQYSASSVQAIVKTAFRAAGIRKKVSTHTLRHCFATHLLENGTDLRYIQTLMGHSSSKTTEIYTHVTRKGFDQIQNPLDSLNF